MKTKLTTLSAAFFLAAAALTAAPKTYKADEAHSGVTFKIRHFFTTVPGNFGDFESTIVFDEEDPSKSSVTATIEVDSVDTNNDDRDDHLEGDDFFNEEKYPDITFKSTSWEKSGENTFTVKGDLTMAGETKEVTLDTTLLGIQKNQKGKMVSGWEVKATIDRRDWGISYGQGVVGNEVTIEIFIQAPEA